MNKYALIVVIFFVAVSKLSGQNSGPEFYSVKLMASFDRVKEAMPELAARLGKSNSSSLTSIYENDSSAAFEITERNTNTQLLVDNEKEYERLLSEAKTDPYKPSIYMLYEYELKDKTASVIPPKKPLSIIAYGLVWTLTIKKIAEKETNIVIRYKGEAKAFTEKIRRESESDAYYNIKIVKSAIDDLRMRNMVRDILLKELRVDQDNSITRSPAN
ncbi:hypothetical protein [Sphingobacterium sp. HMA12]|uniref:hypothetical protein n=1 Tax=Sphingobacterium sp. HMA12 TaxID=2050894 RepID=UPI000CE9BDAF|nr:hypothetical protein [Sphingobacterium sp. HMA12]